MKLLLINYEMNDASPVLSWQATVARALAARCEEVHVLTEKVGRYQGAPNLTVHVMPRWPWGVPKRFGGGFFVNPQLATILRSFKADVCFIHMASTWSYRLWPVLAWYQVPVLLWYAHGSVSRRLRLALRCVDRVITSTPEGFRIETPKRKIIGQAIDTQIFQCQDVFPSSEIVYVGRISARKRVLLLLDVLANLKRLAPERPWRLKLVGPTLTEDDKSYIEQVRQRCAELGLSECVELTGAMTQAETAKLYRTAALHLNCSETGSMDKTVMEALSSGCAVLTTNIAFAETLHDFPPMFSADSTPAHLAEKALALVNAPPPRETLRALVVGHNDLAGWTDKVVAQLEDLIKQRKAAG